jgi:hypothetical protein
MEKLIIIFGLLLLYMGIFTMNDQVVQYMKVKNEALIYITYPLVALVGLSIIVVYNDPGRNKDGEEDDKK